jgi:hypothetical protein
MPISLEQKIRSIFGENIIIHVESKNEETEPDMLWLEGEKGLNLSVMYNFNQDMSLDYEKFSCAPFIFKDDGEKSFANYHNWPFPEMCMDMSANQLKDFFEEINRYQPK